MQLTQMMALIRIVPDGMDEPKLEEMAGYTNAPTAGTNHLMWERMGMNMQEPTTIMITPKMLITSPITMGSVSTSLPQTSSTVAPHAAAAWNLLPKNVVQMQLMHTSKATNSKLRHRNLPRNLNAHKVPVVNKRTQPPKGMEK
mmetsp:Transcript_119551/g.343453  ORF Transcript_119551/g.343453 Transcript_119551/m.343453 type:complete len:143 (-) Transcript_119551:347-775(-)